MTRKIPSSLSLKALTAWIAGAMTALVFGAYASADSLNTDLVSLSQTMPDKVSVGEPIPVVITVTAKQSVANVVVTATLGDGVTVTGSEPKATVAGKSVSWNVGELAQGDSKSLTVTVTAAAEGSVKCCSTVAAEPKICVATVVGKPKINIAKKGPAECLLNDDVTYTVTVWNDGTAVAKDVVVTDNVPDGLTSPDGKKTLTFQVGDLAPDKTWTQDVTLKATKRGQFCNVANVATSNAGNGKAEACTKVNLQELEVAKSGPAKQYTRKTAEYTITAKNPGDVTLTNVVITDTAPEGTSIVKADGAEITGNTAVWKVAELKAGATVSKKITLTSEVAGTHCNGAAVTTAQGVNGKAEACTEWIGYPAILLEVVDTKDPLLPGEETTYIIDVTNQGTAQDTNVKIVANFPVEISPVSASGSTACQVNGKTVTTAPYAVLKPKEKITWKIVSKAQASTGDARLKVQLFSDLLKTPVNEEESTHVY